MRAFISEQGALLRAELLDCLKDAVAPILAESAALRAWQGRALSFLDKACGPLPTPQPTLAVNNDLGSFTSLSRNPEDAPCDVSLADPAAVLEDAGLLGQLQQLHLAPPPLGSPGAGSGSASPGLDTGYNSPLHAMPLLENEAWDAAARSSDSTGAASQPSLVVPLLLDPALAPTSPPPRLERDLAQVSQHNDGAVVPEDPVLDFMSSVAGPVVQPLLGTPSLRKKKKTVAAARSPRRSGRIAIKKKARQLSEGSVAVHELIARVCDILAPAASFDDASLAAYQQLFLKAPLAATAIKALEALVKQVKKVKKKSPATSVAITVSNGVDV